SVRGEVVSVNVKANIPIKAGHLLFSIDPVPYQNKVDAINAQLVSAELDYQRAVELMKKNIGKQRDVDTSKASLDHLKAMLHDAEYDLSQTQVRADGNGYITQMLVYPGLYVVPMPLRPAMIFVQQDSFAYVGWYRQNSSMRLEVGNEAEIAFDALPGKVFSAKVTAVLPVIAEGELQAHGSMMSLNQRSGMPGRIPVIIEITDPRFTALAKYVPGGSYGQSAIYSEHLHHVAIMRKILLRMSSWMSYFFPFH
ncbi:MAG: biotin/lipoyl-binding protein, partial [Colwellia sp.]|nr:biotin/lipoyl-binding protein [Colwellia sp.]